MTRAERLANTERLAREQLERQRTRLAKVQAAQRQETQKVLTRRRLFVGELADQAGLFALDDRTIAALFALLARLCDVPNPVGTLDALLGEPVVPVPVVVEASTAVPCISE